MRLTGYRHGVLVAGLLVALVFGFLPSTCADQAPSVATRDALLVVCSLETPAAQALWARCE